MSFPSGGTAYEDAGGRASKEAHREGAKRVQTQKLRVEGKRQVVPYSLHGLHDLGQRWGLYPQSEEVT